MEYLKLITLEVGHFETIVIAEENTSLENSEYKIEEFLKKHSKDDTLSFVLHMNYDNDIHFTDYKKVMSNIHPLDYLFDLAKNHKCKVLLKHDNVKCKYLEEHDKQ